MVLARLLVRDWPVFTAPLPAKVREKPCEQLQSKPPFRRWPTWLAEVQYARPYTRGQANLIGPAIAGNYLSARDATQLADERKAHLP